MAAYLRNRCYSKRIQCTPYELLTGNKPNVSKLNIFGSHCFAYKSQGSGKLETKSEPGIFIGYDTESPAYLVYFPDSQAVKRERLVKFTNIAPKVVVQSPPTGVIEVPVLPMPTPNTGLGGENVLEAEEETPPAQVTDETPQNETSAPLRKSSRTSLKPKYLQDYVTSAHDESFIHHCFRASVDDIPKNHKQAINSPQAAQWKKAMDQEMQALKENGTYDLAPLPPGKSAVGGRWVYSVKPDPSGERYKARFVAQGYSQEKGTDYDETFAPTAKMTSLRTFVHIAARLGLNIHQLDVKAAYLNAEIDREVYVQQPPGYEVEGEEKLYCKLKKSLYGLKQSGRLWNKNIHEFLISSGFKQSQADHCLYTKHDGRKIVLVLLWVDDIIVASNCDKVMVSFKNAMKQKYRMSDLGEVNWFLGITFSMGETFISMDQSKYISKILERFQMTDCIPVKTPCETCFNDTMKTDSQELAGSHLYREIVGSLIYVMIATRPDLSFVVTKLSQFMSKPNKCHLNAAKRVLRYLKGTIEYKLTFPKIAEPLALSGFCDSDWGAGSDRKSISGYGFNLQKSGPLIAWKSKKQQVVALSTCEAEYVAMTHAIQEALYLKQLVCDLTNSCDIKVSLGVDNQSALKLCKNPVFHQRSKHIDIKYHFIRDIIQKDLVNVYYVQSSQNLADIFTKAVPCPRLKSFVHILGIKLPT